MRKFIGSFGHIGFLPIMGGTYGSAAAAVIGVAAVVLCKSWLVLPPLALVSIIAGVKLAHKAEEDYGASDPQAFVLDEVAGQFISMFAISHERWLVPAVIAFFSFRVFDVLKPWPIRCLEKLPAGWGVVADDIVAGGFALAVTQIALFLLTGANS